MPPLKDVKRRIVINAGHHNADPGAFGFVERDEAKKIRDAVAPLLKAKGFEVLLISDDKTLPQSITEANKMVPTLKDGLCIDIHLNSSSDKSARGTEAYHGTSQTSMIIADAMAFHVAKSLGLKNRGGKPDTETHAGSLGWIRQTKGWAVLIEICFISNTADMKALTAPGGYEKAAQGIVNAVSDMFNGLAPMPTKPGVPEAMKLLNQAMDILKNL